MPEWKRKEGESERAHIDRVFDMKMMADVMRRDRIKPEDPDFKETLSQYMAGEIDPSVARHVEFDVPETTGINLYGQYNPSKDQPYEYSGAIDEKDVSYTLAPDEVAAFHTRNTPSTWAHEFRHRNFPDLSENNNRIMDLYAAQTDYDVDDAIRMESDLQNRYRRRSKLKALPPSAEIGDLRRLKSRGDFRPAVRNALEAFGTTDEEAWNASKTKEFYDDAVALDKYNRGLPERNEKRKKGEPETWADALREAYEKMGVFEGYEKMGLR